MGIRLREVREGKFVTQAELSQATGIAEATISRIENGLQAPRISTVRRLAEALGVHPSELMDLRSDSEKGEAAT